MKQENTLMANIRLHLKDLEDYIAFLEAENESLRDIIITITNGKNRINKDNQIAID